MGVGTTVGVEEVARPVTHMQVVRCKNKVNISGLTYFQCDKW